MAKTYLQISLLIDPADRESAAKVYHQYKSPFLETIKGALSKELLIRDQDIQVLHGFNDIADAKAYLSSELFNQDVVIALQPYLAGDPEVRIYSVA